MAKNLTTADIRKKIETIIDPATGKTLQETEAIKHIGIDPEKDIVILIVAVFNF